METKEMYSDTGLLARDQEETISGKLKADKNRKV